jgi:hypothetical protein
MGVVNTYQLSYYQIPLKLAYMHHRGKMVTVIYQKRKRKKTREKEMFF